MADSINLVFSKTINSSIQVGDTVYKSIIDGNGGAGAPIVVGNCTAINATRDTITCSINEWEDRPTTSNFMLFTKDNKANLSSLKGYYAEVKFVNDSKQKAELFSVAAEIQQSSK